MAGRVGAADLHLRGQQGGGHLRDGGMQGVFVLMEGSGQTGERAWGQPLSAGVAREVRTSSQDGSARLPPPPKGDVSLASRGAAAG